MPGYRKNRWSQNPSPYARQNPYYFARCCNFTPWPMGMPPVLCNAAAHPYQGMGGMLSSAQAAMFSTNPFIMSGLLSYQQPQLPLAQTSFHLSQAVTIFDPTEVSVSEYLTCVCPSAIQSVSLQPISESLFVLKDRNTATQSVNFESRQEDINSAQSDDDSTQANDDDLQTNYGSESTQADYEDEFTQSDYDDEATLSDSDKSTSSDSEEATTPDCLHDNVVEHHCVECVICLVKYPEKPCKCETCRVVCCYICIDEWLKYSGTCPHCRSEWEILTEPIG